MLATNLHQINQYQCVGFMPVTFSSSNVILSELHFSVLFLSTAAHYLYTVTVFISIKLFDFCHLIFIDSHHSKSHVDDPLLVSLQFCIGKRPTKSGFCWMTAGSLAV